MQKDFKIIYGVARGKEIYLLDSEFTVAEKEYIIPYSDDARKRHVKKDANAIKLSQQKRVKAIWDYRNR